MPQTPKSRISRRSLAAIPIAIFAAAIITLIVVNVTDYIRFHRVLKRLESLSDDQLRALGDAAARITQLSRSDQISGFESLHPIKATLYPNSSDFLLYELRPAHPRDEYDTLYLYVRISTSRSNQRIIYFTNSSGRQRTKVLWNRNPEFVAKHNPPGRILTVSEWGREGRSWIVLKDRILVIDENSYVGNEPAIVGSVPLTAAGLASIQEAIAKLPVNSRGKAYRDEGILDGTQVRILFDQAGENSSDDIVINNVWVEDFRPLLTTVSALAPKEQPIGFIDYMTNDENPQNRIMTVRTLEDMEERLNWGAPIPPWWCFWRRLFE